MLYFDHNATTPVAPGAADAMNLVLRQVFGNPSSTHSEGQRARQSIENARRSIASFLGVAPAELVFTSGGTESNNLAILGLIKALPGDRKHAITTKIEHPAVLEPFRQLEREGVAVSYLAVDKTGAVSAEELERHLRPETILVSVMHANNETGVIQPIAEIAAIVHRLRQAGRSIYFHSDGVQALGKTDVTLAHPGVDLYSISAHKIYAPKGTGALIVRKNIPLHGIQLGGRHERERRAGTENVPGILAFARAIELCAVEDPLRLALLRNRFEKQILSALDEVEVNGTGADRLANTSNLLFRGVSGEALLIALDVKGMAVSTGSACSSGAVEPSHVLLAMGRTREEAKSSVRFSFGRYNSEEEVDQLADAVIACVRRLRKTRVREVQFV
ncbi:MAG TPA: cysteine desulfurase family protein [Bryobacteraceae bacterium]|nr:cysteine desulfurase family protein [Bryobacteraceae bacterium]